MRDERSSLGAFVKPAPMVADGCRVAGGRADATGPLVTPLEERELVCSRTAIEAAVHGRCGQYGEEGGVHWLSFAASLGMEVESVHSFATSGVDTSLVVLKYANGAVGSLAFSWELRAPFGGLRLSKVQGTHGAITVESNGLAMLTTGPRLQVRLPALSDPTGRRAMWLDFLRALRTGAETHYTLDMAQRDLRMVELCRTQRREEINEPLRSRAFADQNQPNIPLTV